MKLLVCTNFAQPFHTGGAERVVQQITESMTKDFGWDCTVFCQYGNNETIYNGVKIKPIGSLSEVDFLREIENLKPDHIFVYSDWFFRWETILQNSKNISAKKSIGLVGMNRMRSSIPKNAIVGSLFKNKHSQFKVLAHDSKYIDAETCRNWDIPVSIIHNAIDLKEFVKSDFDFKKTYNINTDKMLLCVSNFFPGKGQEYLLPISKLLLNDRKDFSLVFISSTLSFEPGNKLRKITEQSASRMNLPIISLKDIPREHVVQSYFASDILIFPSQQECGPIVTLESMAASRPWVGLNVGHIPSLRGGICIETTRDGKDFANYNVEIFKTFEYHINTLLNYPDISASLGNQGRLQIEDEYNWDKVKIQYRDFFNA